MITPVFLNFHCVVFLLAHNYEPVTAYFLRGDVTMTAVGLARLQFGGTLLFHFLFVPLTIGMGILIAVLETFYVRTKAEEYKVAVKFWMKIYLVNFAVGVVTGIIQEFQFGTNWSQFSRFVGDIFGAPLAIEVLMAFFLESTFLGIWIYGWDYLSPRLHLLSVWLTSIASVISAFWILTANSFMQEPVGYMVRHGRAEMVNFFALLGNPQLWLEFPHTVFGAMALSSFFMASVSAYHLIRHTNDAVFDPSYRLAMTSALIFSVLVFVLGHEQAQHLITAQPMKMAASEALWHTSPLHAPWTVIGWINVARHATPFVIQIPDLLSILAYNRFTGRVLGITELNHLYQKKFGMASYIPPVNPTFWSFRIMIFVGTAMMLIAMVGTYMMAKKVRPRWFLVLTEWTLILPYMATTSGWLMTEVGRQPWIVFGLMFTAKANSPLVSLTELWTTVIAFGLVYLSVGAAAVYLFVHIIHAGPQTEEGQEARPKPQESLFVTGQERHARGQDPIGGEWH